MCVFRAHTYITCIYTYIVYVYMYICIYSLKRQSRWQLEELPGLKVMKKS